MDAFRIEIPQDRLDDLHARLDLTRWPDELPGAGWGSGVPLAYLQELARYWRHDYDWRRHERRLNEFPQFTTEIDGQRVHFLHVRSAKPDARPLVLTHGWPGSVVEFLRVLEPLSADFHLVVPSLPGYGFSGPTTEAGWDVLRIARAWAELMRRLGYDRYAAHGGDWGALVTRELGRLDAGHVTAVHLTMLPGGGVDGEELTEDEQRRLDSRRRYQRELSGYSVLQSQRPQTLAYALHDSPVGQLAWIVEKFHDWTDSTDAPEDAVDRDQLLTNVMVYWLTGTAGSSARLYQESAAHWRTPREPSPVPTGVSVFPKDLALPLRRFAERTENVVWWTEHDRGGHFPAMEQPDLLVADLRKFLL
ncbi:microsomal epoxide hydrolase [Amycolatopsis bartoniae]|uniref:Microsomal epoxide hydrolase n=1 Tax=Amycolatopsis bartoniae TaxID=941986 RepID=A0A8H9MAM4_9PSEU|nr:epoxide hydrolase family protein [Amycolatopsis bartoniae]MBB2939270.1 microsomal epoxide hydrolase [Amycolatopsis bartoniae]TVT08727.1 epoxide hydrolase [Amycolatopsis bartoniae]GHF37686.1 microsomal epoxide hydrolase [Amycolatopsis bartoniae]